MKALLFIPLFLALAACSQETGDDAPDIAVAPVEARSEPQTVTIVVRHEYPQPSEAAPAAPVASRQARRYPCSRDVTFVEDGVATPGRVDLSAEHCD